jgi:hypothetical protein
VYISESLKSLDSNLWLASEILSVPISAIKLEFFDMSLELITHLPLLSEERSLYFLVFALFITGLLLLLLLVNDGFLSTEDLELLKPPPTKSILLKPR